MVGTQHTQAGDGRGRLPFVVLACASLALWLSVAAAARAEDAPAAAKAPTPAVAMRTAATAFLASLPKAQRAQAARPWHDRSRTRWSGFPGRRTGVAWRELGAAQRKTARALLVTGLGERGLRHHEGVVRLEGILRAQEARQVRRNPSWRHPELYVFTVFGTPGATGTWGWRFEGHHQSWNFTITGERVGITPRFLGANPATVARGPHKGLRVLGAEEDAGRRVLAALDDKSYESTWRMPTAVISVGVPEVRPSGNPDLRKKPRAGLKLSMMSKAQQEAVWALIETWARGLHPALGKRIVAEARATRPGDLHFVWMGRAQGNCYYRVHGDTVHLEFSKLGNHVHSVWRDPRGDFVAR